MLKQDNRFASIATESMYLEEKVDFLIDQFVKLNEYMELFIPDLSTEKGVISFLQISSRTLKNYIEKDVFQEGIHYENRGKKRVYVSDEILNFKKSGQVGRHRKSTKADKIAKVKNQLGMMSECRSVS